VCGIRLILYSAAHNLNFAANMGLFDFTLGGLSDVRKYNAEDLEVAGWVRNRL